MSLSSRRAAALLIIVLIAACIPVSAQRRQTGARVGGQPQNRGGRQVNATAQRIEQRSYVFSETKERIEYGVFVSSRVNRRNPSPLVIALHGAGVPPVGMLRFVTDAAEAGGYIVAAPMGYSLTGWYGITGPPGAVAPEFSEKDVMNVLDLMRQEFNIDSSRIYLLGQSMGGAGALYLGTKYPQIWAAVGATAPAAGSLRPEMLERAAAIPMMLVHGDADEAVPVEQTRRWAQKMSDLKMTYEYLEIRGGTHPDAIAAGAPRVFTFFSKYSKPQAGN